MISIITIAYLKVSDMVQHVSDLFDQFRITHVLLINITREDVRSDTMMELENVITLIVGYFM